MSFVLFFFSFSFFSFSFLLWLYSVILTLHLATPPRNSNPCLKTKTLDSNRRHRCRSSTRRWSMALEVLLRSSSALQYVIRRGERFGFGFSARLEWNGYIMAMAYVTFFWEEDWMRARHVAVEAVNASVANRNRVLLHCISRTGYNRAIRVMNCCVRCLFLFTSLVHRRRCCLL